MGKFGTINISGTQSTQPIGDPEKLSLLNSVLRNPGAIGNIKTYNMVTARAGVGGLGPDIQQRYAIRTGAPGSKAASRLYQSSVSGGYKESALIQNTPERDAVLVRNAIRRRLRELGQNVGADEPVPGLAPAPVKIPGKYYGALSRSEAKGGDKYYESKRIQALLTPGGSRLVETDEGLVSEGIVSGKRTSVRIEQARRSQQAIADQLINAKSLSPYTRSTSKTAMQDIERRRKTVEASLRTMGITPDTLYSKKEKQLVAGQGVRKAEIKKRQDLVKAIVANVPSGLNASERRAFISEQLSYQQKEGGYFLSTSERRKAMNTALDRVRKSTQVVLEDIPARGTLSRLEELTGLPLPPPSGRFPAPGTFKKKSPAEQRAFERAVRNIKPKPGENVRVNAREGTVEVFVRGERGPRKKYAYNVKTGELSPLAVFETTTKQTARVGLAPSAGVFERARKTYDSNSLFGVVPADKSKMNVEEITIFSALGSLSPKEKERRLKALDAQAKKLTKDIDSFKSIQAKNKDTYEEYENARFAYEVLANSGADPSKIEMARLKLNSLATKVQRQNANEQSLVDSINYRADTLGTKYTALGEIPDKYTVGGFIEEAGVASAGFGVLAGSLGVGAATAGVIGVSSILGLQTKSTAKTFKEVYGSVKRGYTPQEMGAALLIRGEELSKKPLSVVDLLVKPSKQREELARAGAEFIYPRYETTPSYLGERVKTSSEALGFVGIGFAESARSMFKIKKTPGGPKEIETRISGEYEPVKGTKGAVRITKAGTVLADGRIVKRIPAREEILIGRSGEAQSLEELIAQERLLGIPKRKGIPKVVGENILATGDFGRVKIPKKRLVPYSAVDLVSAAPPIENVEIKVSQKKLSPLEQSAFKRQTDLLLSKRLAASGRTGIDLVGPLDVENASAIRSLFGETGTGRPFLKGGSVFYAEASPTKVPLLEGTRTGEVYEVGKIGEPFYSAVRGEFLDLKSGVKYFKGVGAKGKRGSYLALPAPEGGPAPSRVLTGVQEKGALSSAERLISAKNQLMDIEARALIGGQEPVPELFKLPEAKPEVSAKEKRALDSLFGRDISKPSTLARVRRSLQARFPPLAEGETEAIKSLFPEPPAKTKRFAMTAGQKKVFEFQDRMRELKAVEDVKLAAKRLFEEVKLKPSTAEKEQLSKLFPKKEPIDAGKDLFEFDIERKGENVLFKSERVVKGQIQKVRIDLRPTTPREKMPLDVVKPTGRGRGSRLSGFDFLEEPAKKAPRAKRKISFMEAGKAPKSERSYAQRAAESEPGFMTGRDGLGAKSEILTGTKRKLLVEEETLNFSGGKDIPDLFGSFSSVKPETTSLSFALKGTPKFLFAPRTDMKTRNVFETVPVVETRSIEMVSPQSKEAAKTLFETKTVPRSDVLTVPRSAEMVGVKSISVPKTVALSLAKQEQLFDYAPVQEPAPFREPPTKITGVPGFFLPPRIKAPKGYAMPELFGPKGKAKTNLTVEILAPIDPIEVVRKGGPRYKKTRIAKRLYAAQRRQLGVFAPGLASKRQEQLFKRERKAPRRLF